MGENDNGNGTRAAAQLAAATANIVKGAAEGGAYGAAAAAVKSFLPQIVKTVAGLLLFLLCLPLIIFVALPSCLFGFPSVMDEEIQDMTAQAQTAYGNYAQTQQSIQNHADAVLQQASEGFDDVVATKDLQGFDAYWMASISSVLHMQELDAINESEIRNIAQHTVRQTSSVETYYEEEEYLYTYPDGTTEIRTREVERRRLHISLRASSPDEVMSSIGFTEEQRQWAAYIHDNIADNQTQGDSPAVDMGDVTFTDAEIPAVYYAQTDSRWSGISYSGSIIGITGCGPTSVAIAASTLTGRAITPPEVAAWSEATGHAAYGNGSYHSLIPDALAYYGLTVQRAETSSAQQLVDALSSGKLVVVIMGPGTFTTSGHFMVLRGVTVDGKVLVADPYSYSFSQREWDLSLIMREAKRSASAGGPFWIVSR